MAMDSISLTAGMRANLTSLQGTVDLLNRTQERLATGKKVNSALDNATAFFAAAAHTQRAGDLSLLKEGMGEAIQVIKAADSGISAITDLIDNLKAVAQDARTAGTTEVTSLEAQYDEIRTQIDNLSNDSSYKGTNLIGGDNLTVTFNEDASSTLAVTGFDATVAGDLSISAAALDTSANIDTAVGELDAALDTLRTNAKTLGANLNVVTVRESFTTEMVNTLTEGADKLTLADLNEEGANMLMLQTRQALGTTALSLSSQAAQSVLRLF